MGLHSFKRNNSSVDSYEKAPATSSRTGKAVRATLILIPLLGLQYIVTPFRPEPGTPWESVYQVTSAVVASCQGLCVALLFCFCNGEVSVSRFGDYRRRINDFGLPVAPGTVRSEEAVETLHDQQERIVEPVLESHVRIAATQSQVASDRRPADSGTYRCYRTTGSLKREIINFFFFPENGQHTSMSAKRFRGMFSKRSTLGNRTIEQKQKLFRNYNFFWFFILFFM